MFIVHHLIDDISPNSRGLGFGVGTEPLTSLFASFGANVMATDAPDDQGKWNYNDQWAGAKESLYKSNIVSSELFDQRVTYQPCDMNEIPDDFRDYDFAWSSCSLEHLGSLEAGTTFIENSIKTLRTGGIAVHTTEFNVTSDNETVEDGPTVLYRKRDLLGLADRLRLQGHTVQPFRIGPASQFLDNHVDVPPFTALPHLKLRIAGHVVTSAGLVIRAGSKSVT